MTNIHKISFGNFYTGLHINKNENKTDKSIETKDLVK